MVRLNSILIIRMISVTVITDVGNFLGKFSGPLIHLNINIVGLIKTQINTPCETLNLKCDYQIDGASNILNLKSLP